MGVSRQWNGRLGKTENSQVAVFGALCAGDRVIPIDVELFLPENWTEDKERCLRSGVPEDRHVHKTKPELALDIVRRQRQLGIRFDYVSADGLYGNSMPFCQALDDEKEVFAELCDIVEEAIELYKKDGKPLPAPTSGKDYANKMLSIT